MDSLLHLITQLEGLALSSRGPGGRTKIISATANAAAGVFTSCSSRLLTGMTCKDPQAQLLLQLTYASQQHSCGDSGLLALHVACSLIRHALEHGRNDRARRAIAAGYQQCLDHVAYFLGQSLDPADAPCSSPSLHLSGPSQSTTLQPDHRAQQQHPEPHHRVHSTASTHTSTDSTTQEHFSSGSWVDQWLHGTAYSQATGPADSLAPSSHCSTHPASDSAQPHNQASGRRRPTAGEAGGCREPCPLCLDVRPLGLRGYLALLRSVVCSKPGTGLSPAQQEAVCFLLIKAHVAALPLDPSTPAHQLLLPRVLVVPGLDPEEGLVLEGVALEQRVPAGSRALLPLGPALVALFEVALEPEDTATTNTAQPGAWRAGAPGSQLQLEVHQSDTTAPGWSARSTQLAVMLQLVVSLSKLGVKVLACQKGIHAEVAAAARSLGMLPLARLSAQHAHALALVSGALPIANLLSVTSVDCGTSAGCCVGQADRDRLGVIKTLEVKVEGHKTYIHVTGPSANDAVSEPAAGRPASPVGGVAVLQHARRTALRRRAVSTVVLGTPSDSCCDELHSVATSALRVLQQAMSLPWVLPGGGAWQAAAAAYMRWCMPHLEVGHNGSPQAHLVHAHEGMARCLECISVGLLAGSGLTGEEAREAINSLGAHNLEQLTQSAQSFAGWRHDTQQFGPVAVCRAPCTKGDHHTQLADATVLDWLPANLSALAAGVSAACVLLKTDQVIVDPS